MLWLRIAAALGRGKRRVNERLAFVDVALLAQSVRQILQYLTQYLLLAPLLEAPMYRLVVRIALRQHVPLSSSVQDPQHRFEHTSRGRGFGPAFGSVLLRKVPPDPLPLLIAQPQHGHNSVNRLAARQRF